MATPGTYISAVGHAGLLIWLLAGWGLSQDPLEFETTNFTTVSGEEFAAMMAARSPNPGTAEPTALVQPEPEQQPDLPEPDETVAAVEPPTPVTPPEEETPPPEAPAPPAPVSDVTDTLPDVVSPPAPEPSPAIDEPIADTPPQQRPSDRVAPEPVAPPEPDVRIDDVAQEATEPTEAPTDEVVPEEPQEETAQEQATEEIVAEAVTPSGAPERSVRPTARPNRPAPVEEPASEPVVSETPPSNDAVENVLADIVGEETPAQPDVPEGPPMSGSEREGFRVAVNACWNVDPGSVAARVTVVAAFSLTPEGKVEANQVRLVSSEGDQSAVDTAFQAARRAILRCQGQTGYDLPAEKYGQWKDVEITFDPSGMRLR
ncbi:Cell division and transport-associated protein TolA [Cognatiyoonia koreensis]|uniref:Cell division and transport-associated protein TolA n=1 Tax=Cognatiyoonia koreensis TaxID=364200 RepID=A0A1I0MNP0_9RHOB|nr:hypothetical protein [Cognatiyoonia koreensis]SEV89289.1 Cell division and transport-associated protein TolA [Cognatiyoonia koreensis]